MKQQRLDFIAYRIAKQAPRETLEKLKQLRDEIAAKAGRPLKYTEPKPQHG